MMLITTKASATASVTPCTRLGSLLVTPLRMRVPIPGIAKMISITTAPPSRYPMRRPSTVTGVMSALRRTLRPTTMTRGMPAPRAVRT
ncbi:Uncharacterised protein [Mycobacterium tuberculosis]|nr:Uncharacterised protein [Mycobacterium tuberculosis]